MSPIQQARCYPRRAAVVAIALVAVTVGGLIVSNSLALEHLLLIGIGYAQPIIIGVVLFGGIEVAVQIWVPVMRWLQTRRRRSNGI
jgi:hypothetical protein